MKGKMYGGSGMSGDMKAHVSDYQTPAKAYSQNYDQAPLNYIERQDKRQGKEAGKLRNEDYKGRYQN